MATKEQRRKANELFGALERRVHAGPPIGEDEIQAAKAFLCQGGFSSASSYYDRLAQISGLLRCRRPAAQAKRNYGGEAAGRMMQVQSIYDHVILSMCYKGEINRARGRVKISHRFNCEGRVDFVELKFLQAMRPFLTGEIRKLLLVKDGQNLRRDWHSAEAHVLPVLPQELVFLHPEIFRFERGAVLAWLVNLGHQFAEELLGHLAVPSDGQGGEPGSHEQMPLGMIRSDGVALPVLEKAATLSSAVEVLRDKLALVRYVVGS